MHRVGICFTVNSYGPDTELSRSSNDSTCNLASNSEGINKKVDWLVIDEVPVGYEDLVKMRFRVRKALEVARYSTEVSSDLTLSDMGRVLFTCSREVPDRSGKVGTGDWKPVGGSGVSREGPRCCMSL